MDDRSDRETIVVIDDDYAMRLSCRQILTKSGFQVETFEDGAQGLEGVSRLRPGLVVVDLKMPGLSGLEVIARIHDIDPHIILVVITGYATIGTAVEAMKAGAYDFLPKPFKPDELRVIVDRGLERRRLWFESRRSELDRELLRRRFMTLVSHQLKTPLAAVHQYLDVLKHIGDTPQAAEKRTAWLDRCIKRTEEIKQLIDDWLTLARVEGATMARERGRVDVRAVVDGILDAYQELAASEDVSLNIEFPEGHYCVNGDRNCLAVLFDNLVANAIKYNKRGGSVTVTAERCAGELVFSVTDTGIGIPEKYREFLFDEFFRVKGSEARDTSGTGLGLPICKRIATELGGTIEVESEVDKSSTFRVRLPEYSDRDHDVNTAGVASATQDPDRR